MVEFVMQAYTLLFVMQAYIAVLFIANYVILVYGVSEYIFTVLDTEDSTNLK